MTTELNALRARDELVASVSHELRTPLTSILGYLDLAIEDPDLPDHLRSNLDVAERNAERLLGIIADILAASSSSSSVEASLAPLSIDARDIVRASAEALAPRAAGRAITIDTTGLEEAFVWADPLRLRQVVDNLLSNAITYNRDGGTVFLGTTSDGASSWILVRDTGTGMTEDERARLFQRFYKAGPPRRSGTGLGLAISRDIVRAHGGELGLHSSPGVGSTFIVKLPATAPEGTPVMILDLDLYSVLVMTAVVVNVSGVLFIVETLLRRDEGAGRIWALAFLAAMLTTLAYVIWVQSPEAWWAIAVGNAAVRRGTGCMWLGCRRFNGRRMAWSSVARGGRGGVAAATSVFVGGSGRGRLGGCAVDVHPPARLRRRRGGRVPARRAPRIAHGVGAQRRARVPVAVLPVAHDRVPHVRPRQLAVPERVRHDPHELRHGHAHDRRGRGHVRAAGVAGADARAPAGPRATARRATASSRRTSSTARCRTSASARSGARSWSA